MSQTQTTIVVEQGDTLDVVIGPVRVRNPITGALTPIDLTANGVQLWLTAKRSFADADNVAVFQLTIGSGITVNSPASADKNYATARVQPGATEALTVPVDLVFDVQLLEPDGRKTTLGRGKLPVVPDVTNA